MTIYSSILALEIPWTEEPGGLQAIGLQSQTCLKLLSMHPCTLRRPQQQTVEAESWLPWSRSESSQ